MIKAIGVGAGGHAKVLINAQRLAKDFEIVGLLSASEDEVGTLVLGVPVLGTDERIEELFAQGIRHAFVGVGSTGHPRRRVELYERLRRVGYTVIPTIHPSAVVAESATLGDGVMILPKALIGAASHLCDNVIVNNAAVVSHDCHLENHVHISPGALLAGGVRVGEFSHVGIGACVIENITIGPNCIIAAGAVVTEDVESGVVVAGVPARLLKRVATSFGWFSALDFAQYLGEIAL